MRRLRGETGQTLVMLAGACVLLLLFVGVLGALGKALLGRGRLQQAADLAAVSAAQSMRDDFPRLIAWRRAWTLEGRLPGARTRSGARRRACERIGFGHRGRVSRRPELRAHARPGVDPRDSHGPPASR